MRSTIWVAQLNISDATAHKISSRHGVHADEIKDALICVPGLTFTWNDDPERGERAIVEVHIRGMRVLVVLYEADDPMGGVWNLGSAYPVP